MSNSITAARLSELVGLIYDAAIDPSRWLLAMEAIRTELNFHNSTMNLQRLPTGEVLTNVTSNVPPEYIDMMESAGAHVLESWGGVEALYAVPMDRAAVLTKVNPAFDPATSTNLYFAEFARPQGIDDVLAIGLARDLRALGSMAFGRHKSAGPIGEREIEVAELLIPHLQRAATINRMLDHAALVQRSFELTLDTLAVPVLLIGRDLAIVHANPAAKALLDRGDLVRVANGVLTFYTTGVSAALVAAVEQGAQNESGLGRRGLGIPLRRADGSAGALHVLPLRSGRTATDTGAVAALFFADADSPFVPPTEIVMALFGLSPAEARVFTCIAQGLTVSETAVELGVSRATVRTHLLRIYDKTGTHRQADLLVIAASLSVPIAG